MGHFNRLFKETYGKIGEPSQELCFYIAFRGFLAFFLTPILRKLRVVWSNFGVEKSRFECPFRIKKGDLFPLAGSNFIFFKIKGGL